MDPGSDLIISYFCSRIHRGSSAGGKISRIGSIADMKGMVTREGWWAGVQSGNYYTVHTVHTVQPSYFLVLTQERGGNVVLKQTLNTASQEILYYL